MYGACLYDRLEAFGLKLDRARYPESVTHIRYRCSAIMSNAVNQI